MAEGDVIAFLDSDDFWLEKKLEDQTTFMNTNKAFSFCYTDAVVFDLDQKESPHSYIYKYRSFNDYQGKIAHKLFLEHNVIPTSSVMVRKQLLLDVGCFDENLQYHEDRDLWIRLAEKGDVIFLDKALSVYTVHSGQFTHENDALREKQWQMVIEKYKDWYRD